MDRGPLENEIRERLGRAFGGLESFSEITATGPPQEKIPLDDMLIGIMRDLNSLAESVVKLAAEVDRLKGEPPSH